MHVTEHILPGGGYHSSVCGNGTTQIIFVLIIVLIIFALFQMGKMYRRVFFACWLVLLFLRKLRKSMYDHKEFDKYERKHEENARKPLRPIPVLSEAFKKSGKSQSLESIAPCLAPV